MLLEAERQIQHFADECEKSGDIRGWIRAMRRLCFGHWWGYGDKVPPTIPVTQEFYDLLEDHVEERRIGSDVHSMYGGGVYFREILIHPEVYA